VNVGYAVLSTYGVVHILHMRYCVYMAWFACCTYSAMYMWYYVYDCTCGAMCMWCRVHVVGGVVCRWCCVHGVHVVLCISGTVYTSCMWSCVHVVLVVMCTCGAMYMLCR